jgi:vitamin B12/bleomycin/antimicrobial peptide transport system ATP-binding/permease protein
MVRSGSVGEFAMRERKRSFLRDAWRLSKPYFGSEERWLAWGLLIAIVALTLASVYLDVRFNYWRNDFYNSLQQRNGSEFLRLIGVFSLLAAINMVVAVYAQYLNQMLQIRWRRWLTRRYLGGWLAHRAYYRLELTGSATDNPDQRIAQDLDLFTANALGLSLGLLNAVVTLGSFLFILWALSGAAAIPLGRLGQIYVPAYLVWAALLYAGIGTWLTIKIGWPLVPLNFAQQRFEADFRFSLVRLRENAENVAFYGGEARERGVFARRFGRLFDNFWQIMKRTKRLNWFTSGYNQIIAIFPIVLIAPRYFAQQIELGGLMQTVDAFDSVQSSLSFIINAYTNIAAWQAVIQRLGSFEDRLNEIGEAALAPQPIDRQQEGAGLDVARLDVDLPDGRSLLRQVSFAVEPGAFALISAPTGTGKSTLLRAIAGLWPFGRGRIRLGQGPSLFLPQRPYLPLGTLRQALLYPREDEDVPPERLAQVLRAVGLAALVDRLDAEDNWSQRLSLGEQQRLAFARILLNEPQIVFLDEATSALDEAGESDLYRLLRQAPFHPTVVSVGHRATLRELHDRVLPLIGAGADRQPRDLATAG